MEGLVPGTGICDKIDFDSSLCITYGRGHKSSTLELELELVYSTTWPACRYLFVLS